MMMLVLLVVVYSGGLYASSTPGPAKSQVLDEYVALYKELFTEVIYLPKESSFDHVAGMQNMADKSDELATKAAQAAEFVARGIYDIEHAERGPLLEPLQKVFEKSAAFHGAIGFDDWRSAFDRLDADVQRFMEGIQPSLDRLYRNLPDAVEVPSWESSANDSENTLLIGHYTTSGQLDRALCNLQVFGSIFGSNCTIAYSNSCEDILSDAPSSIEECANERIARYSANERALNRLAKYAERNVFFAFNYIAFCSALHENYTEIIPDAVEIVRSIADGFALSKQVIRKYLSHWPRLAKTMGAETLTSAASKLNRAEADVAYNRTADDIVDELKNIWFNHEFSSVVYYSFTGPVESGTVLFNGSEEDAFNETAGTIKAFVKRYTPEDADRVKGLWKDVKVDPDTLAVLFEAGEPSTSMTERFNSAKLDAKLFDEGGFRAAAVIPCTYRFVWYELAWQYFHVYGTTSEYVLTFQGKNTFKQCGVVVLFP